MPRTPEQLMQAATDRISVLEEELAEMRDRWMRAEAETANVRARARREVDETRQYAVQKFAADVVEAAENLRRGLDSLPQPAPGEPEIVTRLRDGLAGVERSFLSVLERNGIRREDPTGAAFDPNLHQAMGEQESSLHAPGTVGTSLDAGLDAEWPLAAAGHGCGRQRGARRSRRRAAAGRYHRLAEPP